VQICGTDFLPTLRTLIDDDQIPPEYGGSSAYALGAAPEEAGLAALAAALDTGQLLFD
jgi:hypothetical protein